MSTMQAPPVLPPDWTLSEFPNGTSAAALRHWSGMGVLLSHDFYDGDDVPPTGEGDYVHISLSRPDRYPGWDEMRDFIYGCGFFDASRDVMMLLPRKDQYVNLHSNCFHFYQKREVA